MRLQRAEQPGMRSAPSRFHTDQQLLPRRQQGGLRVRAWRTSSGHGDEQQRICNPFQHCSVALLVVACKGVSPSGDCYSSYSPVTFQLANPVTRTCGAARVEEENR